MRKEISVFFIPIHDPKESKVYQKNKQGILYEMSCSSGD